MTCLFELETLTVDVNYPSDGVVINEDLAAMNLVGAVMERRTHTTLDCFYFAKEDWMDNITCILPVILTTPLEGRPNLKIVGYWMFWQGNQTPGRGNMSLEVKLQYL